jgi:uncharacterized membrane protein
MNRTPSAARTYSVWADLLISTPIAQVPFSIIGFLRGQDWLYVAITLVVLGLLTYSLTSG